MKAIEKIRLWFSGMSSTKPEKFSKFEKLFSISAPVLHPSDMIDEMAVSICMKSKSVAFSSTDISLFEVKIEADLQQPVHYFFGMEHNGYMYGNIIGTSCISRCQVDDYVFTPCSDFMALIKSTDTRRYNIHCTYDKKAFSVFINRLVETNVFSEKQKTLIEFEEEQRPLLQALKILREMPQLH